MCGQRRLRGEIAKDKEKAMTTNLKAKENKGSELTAEELNGIAGGDTATPKPAQSQYPTESVTLNFTAVSFTR